MKTKSLVFILIATFVLIFTACSDEDNSNSNKNGYVPMTNSEYSYAGTYDGTDYDAECVTQFGAGYLSFWVINDGKKGGYTCFESCSKIGSQKSECESVENMYVGLADINSILECEDVDGKSAYIIKELQHCNHACTADMTACD